MPALSIARAHSLSMTLYLYKGLPEKELKKSKKECKFVCPTVLKNNKRKKYVNDSIHSAKINLNI